ncbi:type VII secretion protein EssC [Alkalihalobacterium elongatum]|uniref:type VII secretion protein EssC n=1 Tax=Alkalihalobacterium elongatum TaxID=2675466 RepID=UPI001C1FC563|nr:type VII secretion protein EssC [Alkalihalobacterium elongatum]
MILTLFDRGKAFTLALPENITGKYILTSVDQDNHPIDIMAIEAEAGQWFLKSNKYAFLKNTNNEMVRKVPVELFKTYTIYREGEPTALLYVEPPAESRNQFTRHHVTADTIKIGRGKTSQICFSHKLVSSSHCTIEYKKNGQAVLKDNESSNGTYVNGAKVKEKVLSNGDVIYIMGLKIIFNGRLLSLNNPHQLVFLDKHTFSPFIADKPIQEDEDELDDFNVKDTDSHLFYRSPRFKRDIERKEIKIDPPPQPTDMEETPLMLMLGPSITMGMASMFTALFMVQNVMRNDGDMRTAVPMLVMASSMLIGMVLWPILTKKYEKKKRQKKEAIRQEKYKAYLLEMRRVIDVECEHQSEILRENHIPVENCVARIENRERTLWERVIGQNDFLKVRLGTGNLPLDADIKFPERKFSVDDDNLQEELYEIADTPQILKDVPVTLSLMDEQVSGIIGERSKVKDFVKGLTIQLASLHSYDELKLVFIYDKSEHEDWKFAKWLPHVWDEEKNIRFIASDANELKELSAYFEKEITRQSELQESDLQELTQHIIVFSMSKDLASKAEMFNMLLKEKNKIGFSLVTLYDELEKLPKECSKVVELGNDGSKIFDKDDISGQYTAFNDDIYLHKKAEDLAIQLANIQLATSLEQYTLPNMLTFLEMFGVSKIEHLNAPTRWKENNPTLTIEAPIGVDTMGQPFMIDLHEKYHGPHGLIAGMTGSGKSEFVMTFILSLAVNYHPDEVAFILIDYKGGGMANAFLNLPHLAGTITNLDGAAVKRSLISIQSELKRRQAIFSETSQKINESNIDIYKYQKLYREGVVTEPLQHLFMISDEFAELKTQQPEFMEQLVSAARIGRSLGVHLILATQKPSGVVDDQIWSNSKFRISLKVQEKADSMEVIKRPDAAELKTTGRFYLQVGYNELFELGQSAWAGAPYIPTEKVEKHQDNSIRIIDNLGRVIKSAKVDKQQGAVKNPPKQIDEVTKYLENLAKQENIKVKPLWLEPIPQLIYIDQLKAKYEAKTEEPFVLNPVVGEYDDPANQRQMVMRMPITEEGNTVIYGVAGSGKTTFLATTIYSLMEEHTPDEVNFYMLDFSSETLSWFRQAPHVGDVLLSHESEKISNLFKMLNSEIENRRRLFSNYGGDFSTYNQVASESLPSIVVVIHNYSAFSEMYEQYEEAISFLTREGLRYGIYFILTAANAGAVRYRLLQNFKQLFVLQLNDSSDYSGILGNVDGVYPSKYKGRGIFKAEDGVFEFQVAQIAQDVPDMYSFMTDYCRNRNEQWNGSVAKRIPVLPEKVNIEYLRNEIHNKQTDQLPIGVDKNSLAVTYYDFRASFVNLVLAANGDDCSSFMHALVDVATLKGDSEVIVLDPNGSLTGDASRYQYVSETSALEEMIVHLFNTLVQRNNDTKDAAEEGKVPPVFEQITCFIDSFTDLNMHLSADAQDKLKVFLERGDSLNVNLIISDSVDKISTITFESWFQKQVALNQAIWIGNGITDQYTLKISKITSDMYGEIPPEFGYVVNKGKANVVKLLTATAKEEALAYG